MNKNKKNLFENVEEAVERIQTIIKDMLRIHRGALEYQMDFSEEVPTLLYLYNHGPKYWNLIREFIYKFSAFEHWGYSDDAISCVESELSSFDVETTRMFYGLFGNLFTLTNYQLKLALLHPIDPQAAQANDTVIDFRTIFSQECSCVHYKKMGTSVFYTPESIAQSDAQCHEDFFADQLKIRKIFKLHYEHGGIASCEQMLAYFADEKANLCQRRAPLMWFLLTTVISEEHKRTLGLFKETVTIGFKRKQNVGDAQEESVKTQVATSQSSSLTSGVTTTTKNAATMETRDDNIEAEDEGDDDQQEKRIKTN